jgi:hypothetical protein
MRYAVINNGVVENIIAWDGSSSYTPTNGRTLVASDTASIGWEYNSSTGVFSAPLPAPQIPVVPESITRRQCALQLLAKNDITAQEALNMTKTAEVPFPIAFMFDTQVAQGNWTADDRVRAEIDFAATHYYRNNSLLDLMGLTPAEIDDFFIDAAQR